MEKSSAFGFIIANVRHRRYYTKRTKKECIHTRIYGKWGNYIDNFTGEMVMYDRRNGNVCITSGRKRAVRTRKERVPARDETE